MSSIFESRAALPKRVFSAVNTPEVSIASGANSVFSALSGLICMDNPSTNRWTLVPLYAKMHATSTAAGPSSGQFVLALDAQNRGSGGTLLVAKNRHMGVSDHPSNAIVRFGNVTLVAESGSVRRISRFPLFQGNMVTGEMFAIHFTENFVSEYTLDNAARSLVLAPVAIAPGHSLAFNFWSPGAAIAHGFECEIAWAEV